MVEGVLAVVVGVQRQESDGGGFRQGRDLERHFSDEAERPPGAAVHLRQIVSGDVLDDLAAALHQLAFGIDDGDVEQRIADAAEGEAAQAVGPRGDEAAQCLLFRAGDIERQPLAVWGEDALQVGQSDTRLGRYGQVGGLVVRDGVQTLGGQRQKVAFGRVADVLPYSPTPRDDCLPQRGAYSILRLRRRCGRHDRRRRLPEQGKAFLAHGMSIARLGKEVNSRCR